MNVFRLNNRACQRPHRKKQGRATLAWLLIFIFTVSLVASPLGSAAAANTTPRSAVLTSLEGSVMVQPDGKAFSLPARTGQKLETGDRIITGRDGRAEITFDDGSVSRISPDSRLDFLALYRDGTDGSETTFLGIQWGSLWNNTKDVVTRNSRFEVNTPTAIAGVRGTSFMVRVLKSQTDVETLIRAYSGQLGAAPGEAENGLPAPPAAEVLINPYEQATLTFVDLLPDAADPIDVMDVDDFEKDNLVEDIPVAYVEVETEVKGILVEQVEGDIREGRAALAYLTAELQALARELDKTVDEDKRAELIALQQLVNAEMESRQEMLQSLEDELNELSAAKATLEKLRQEIRDALPVIPLEEINRQIKEGARFIRKQDKEKQPEQQLRQQQLDTARETAEAAGKEAAEQVEKQGLKPLLEEARGAVTPEMLEALGEAKTREDFEGKLDAALEQAFTEPEPEPEPERETTPPPVDDSRDDYNDYTPDPDPQPDPDPAPDPTPVVNINPINAQTVVAGEQTDIAVTTNATLLSATSANPAFAEVTVQPDQKIRIKGIAPGTTTITVTGSRSGYQSASISFQITVTAPLPTTYSLTIAVAGEGSTIPEAGLHRYPENTVVNLNAQPAENWQFDRWVLQYEQNSQKASIRLKKLDNGLIYHDSEIDITITDNIIATAYFVEDTPPVNVSVTGVTLNQSTLNLQVGETAQLEAIITPPDATNKAVSWASSNISVATVSNTGLVTAMEAGSATITVTTEDGAFTASCAITVTETTPADTADLTIRFGALQFTSVEVTSSTVSGAAKFSLSPSTNIVDFSTEIVFLYTSPIVVKLYAADGSTVLASSSISLPSYAQGSTVNITITF